MEKNVFLTLKSIIFFIFLLFLNINVLAQPSLQLISPNGGETLKTEQRYSISWISSDVENINLYFTTNNKNWIVIDKRIVSKIGSYSWEVPYINTNSLKIRISSSKLQNLYDVSDNLIVVKNLNFDFKKKSQILNGTPLKILPLGNSITFDNRFNDTRSVEDKIGYRWPLYNLLTNAGYIFDFIGSEYAGNNFLPPGYDANAGFPGITDDQIYHLLQSGELIMPQFNIDTIITDGPYLYTYSPDIILLHIGTNQNEKPDGTSPADVENILDEIDWYEESSGNEVTVFLARIINRSPNEGYVTALNDSVETMAMDRVNNPLNDAYPDKIIFVDMEDSAGIDYTIDSFGTIGDGILGDMSDLLHPNDKGYLKMAHLWFDSLYLFLGDPITIVSQPLSKGVIEGDSVSFKVKVTGGGSIYYQWRKDNIDISGANDSVYSIPNVSVLDNEKEYSCVIYNKASYIETNKAKLYVTESTSRVTDGEIVYYNFEEGNGSTIYDSSHYGAPLNLDISSASSISWVPYGFSIDSMSIIKSIKSPSKIFNECTTSNEITIETWIVPENNTQTGPARIITYSIDGNQRNFTIGQSGSKYLARIRTTETDNNGLPEFTTLNNVVDTSLTHLVLSKDNLGGLKLFVNGFPKIINNIAGNFSNWDSTFSLGLGNEFQSEGIDRFWLGKYYLVSIYSRALSEQEIIHNYQYGFNGNIELLNPPTNLTGTVENDTVVVLNWIDNESNELGFIIERKPNLLDSVFIVLDTVGINTMSYVDESPKYLTSYFYRLKVFNEYSQSNYSDSILVNGIISEVETTSIPFKFKLYQNYPNPFNPSTSIKYTISEFSDVKLSVYNTLGENIKTLVDKRQIAGEYKSIFDSSGLSSGIYFLILKSRSISSNSYSQEVRKLVLLK